jgi:hypothetical protein
MRILLLFTLSIVLLFSHPSVRAQVAPESNIDRANLERMMGVLAADEMRGRKTFTPDIDRAATYLAAEMKAIGLKPFTGKEYQQRFNVYEVRQRSLGLVLNGLLMKPADFFANSGYDKLDWYLKTQAMPVERIRAGENYRTRLGEIRRGEGTAIVLVDPSHAASFERSRANAQRPQRTLDHNAGPTRVFVLTPDTFLTDYHLQIENDVKALPAANVAGIIKGRRANEMVLISAHYDHIGILPAVDGDSIANGADDDASGTVAMLALARHFALQKKKPERTLVFVAFTAEEVGGYGSQYFARTIQPAKVMAMINLEMLGKPSKWGPGKGFLTGFERSSLGTLAQAAAPGVFEPDPYPVQNLFYRSDNATLARLGVPAHTFSTDQIDIDKFYHTVNDEAITLDFDHMTQIVRAIARAITPLVAGQVTPTRVDTSKVD